MKKSWHKKWWIWVIGLVVLAILIAIPFFINYIYLEKLDEKSGIVFTESDVLSFYGSFLSFLGTVILGIVALVQNEKIRKFSVRVFEMEHRFEKRPKLCLESAALEVDNCFYDSTFEKYQNKKFHSENNCWIIELATHSYSDPDTELYFILTLRNVGEGPAQNIIARWLDDFGIEEEDIPSVFTDIGHSCSIRFKVPIFVGNTIGQPEDRYRIWITYENIYGFKNLQMIDIIAKPTHPEQYEATFSIEMKQTGV